jgi:hypothetical protein
MNICTGNYEKAQHSRTKGMLSSHLHFKKEKYKKNKKNRYFDKKEQIFRAPYCYMAAYGGRSKVPNYGDSKVPEKRSMTTNIGKITVLHWAANEARNHSSDKTRTHIKRPKAK